MIPLGIVKVCLMYLLFVLFLFSTDTEILGSEVLSLFNSEGSEDFHCQHQSYECNTLQELSIISKHEPSPRTLTHHCFLL